MKIAWLLILYFPVMVSAQTKMKVDTVLINRLNKRADYLIGRNSDSARILALKAIELSKPANYLIGLGDAYVRLGKIEKENGNNDQSISYYRISLSYRKQLGDDLLVSRVYNNIANVYNIMDEYDSATYYILTAIKIAEKVNATVDLIKFTNTLGISYFKNENYPKALEYHRLSLQYALQEQDTDAVNRSYGNLGSTYIELEKYDSARLYIHKILQQGEEVAGTARYANACNNMGEIFNHEGNADSAIWYFRESARLWEDLGSPEVNAPLGNLGSVYVDLNNYADGIQYLLRSNDSSFVLGARKQLATNYQNLSRAYAALGNYDEAYHALSLFVAYNDTVFNQQNSRTIAELTAKYAGEKKDLEIQAQKQKSKRQQITQLFSIGLFILLLVVLFLVFRQRQLRKKMEFEQQLVNDRSRISSDLHDDIGSTLGSISYFSQLARMQQEEPEKELNELLEKIEAVSHEAVENMGDIVWAINPANDNFERLIVRIRNYATDCLTAKKIQFELVIDPSIKPDMKLPVEVRKNLFLIFKESIYNAAKYASCTQVRVEISIGSGKLHLYIRDNGTGFDPTNTKSYNGNGMRNMRKRADEVAAALAVESAPGAGTTVLLDIPL